MSTNIKNKIGVYAKLFSGSNTFIFLTYVIVIGAALSSVLAFRASSFLVNIDGVDQTYTWYQKLSTSIHNGYLPLWNIGNYGGQSFAGDFIVGVFYPLNIVWVLVFGSSNGMTEIAINSLIAAHFVLAAFGAFLLFKQLGSKRWTSFLIGLTYALAGAVAARSAAQADIFYGLALVPYPLYFVTRSRTSHRKIMLSLSGIFLGLMILAGHVQPFFNCFLMILALEASYLYTDIKHGLEKIKLIFLTLARCTYVLFVAIIVSLPQLILSAQYLFNTYRVQVVGYSAPGEKIGFFDFAGGFNLNIEELLPSMIDPAGHLVRDGNYVYIGLSALFVIILCLVLFSKKMLNKKIIADNKFFLYTIGTLSILVVLGQLTWFSVILYKLPLLHQIRELGRYIIIFEIFVLAVMAASFETIAKAKFTNKQKKILYILGIFVLINSAYLFLLRNYIYNTHFAIQNLILATTILIIASTQNIKIRKTLLMLAITLSLVINSLWFIPNSKSIMKIDVYARNAEVIGFLSKTNGQNRVFVESGALPVNIGNVYPIQTLGGYSATINAPFYEIMNNTKASKDFVYDLYGVKYIVSKNLSKKENAVFAKNGVYVTERQSALPKLFMTSKDGSTQRSDYSGISVQTIKYNDQIQVFTFELNKSGKVIFSENYFKGWIAEIDGKKTPIKPYYVDGKPLLKSISINKPGKHTVKLRYSPFQLSNN